VRLVDEDVVHFAGSEKRKSVPRSLPWFERDSAAEPPLLFLLLLPCFVRCTTERALLGPGVTVQQ
jgi:hypothetical protein